MQSGITLLYFMCFSGEVGAGAKKGPCALFSCPFVISELNGRRFSFIYYSYVAL